MWKIDYDKVSSERIKQVGEDALAFKEQGFHCSESLIRAVWPYVLPERALSDDVLRIIMPFRGGISGSTSSHCGGLTVGVALAGAIYGRLKTDEDPKLASSVVRMYWRIYLENFGTSNCTLLRRDEPGPEAPSICGCLIARAARLMVAYFDSLKMDMPPLEEVYAWTVDRSQEPCHERVVPMWPNDEH
jgi:hypothetical protein